VYRPAAQQQLATLGQQTDVASLPIVEAEKPLAITKRALQMAKIEGYDVLLLDTAGRLHVDEALMDEVKAIAGLAQPTETLLVADAMTGQDAVNVASAFKQALSLTGIILTRMDSDARGGAALSMRAVTGCPIKFVGMGEKLDALDVFHPERMADRILGMGDVVSLVEKAAATIAEDDAQRMARKLQKGKFDLDDLLQQLKQMQKMGGLSSLMGYIPGLSGLKDKMADANVNDKTMKRQEAMLLSMTPQERKRPDLLNASRKRRIASGSGMTVPDVNRLLKQYQQMQTMMKQMSKMSQKKGGLMRQKLQHLLPR
jgi:signal recognition particle subunit SRP54